LSGKYNKLAPSESDLVGLTRS